MARCALDLGCVFLGLRVSSDKKHRGHLDVGVLQALVGRLDEEVAQAQEWVRVCAKDVERRQRVVTRVW